jgi:hypothetical protein
LTLDLHVVEWHANFVGARWKTAAAPIVCTICGGFTIDAVDAFDGKIARFDVSTTSAFGTPAAADVACPVLREAIAKEPGVGAPSPCACGTAQPKDEMSVHALPGPELPPPACQAAESSSFRFDVVRDSSTAEGVVVVSRDRASATLRIRGASWSAFLIQNEKNAGAP